MDARRDRIAHFVLRLFACGALLAAAAPAALPATEPAATPPASAPAATAAVAASIGKEEAAELAKSIAPIVEEIRGAKFKQPVRVEIIDDAGARRHFEGRIRKYWPERQVRAEEVLYRHLGLLPEPTDLVAVVFDVLEEQAGGFYDPDRDTFFILGDLPRGAAPIIIAHELTHALDDQHFGIDRLLEAAPDEDHAGALDSVIEGSGTTVMNTFIVRQLQAGRLDTAALEDFQSSEMGRGEKLKAAPVFIQRSIVAPYFVGLAFLLRGEMIRMKTGGITPSDIDRAFREPPQSTEQILHPEKYWDPAKADPPRAVDLPDQSAKLGDGFALDATGTLGELTVALLTGLDPGDPNSPDRPLERWTNAAASGWGGDSWQVYRKGAAAISLFVTVWDSEQDAREFEAAVKVAAGVLVQRRGDAVAIAAGDAGGDLKGLARRALAAAPRAGR